jgi:hypothetical protein
MTLGNYSKKKVAVYLAILGPLAFYSVYSNFFSTPGVPESSSSRARPRPEAAEIPQAYAPPTTSRASSRARNEEFRPALHSKRANENRLAPEQIDPTLRTDLLAKVQSVELAGGARNVFQFGPPPAPKVEPIKGPEPIVKRAFVGPIKPPDPKPPGPPPPPPPPPPIPLKFYGYYVASGKKTAYFLHNEDIILGAEGETVERRYRVVKINPTSVIMEDTEVKKQQTLPLVEEAQGE